MQFSNIKTIAKRLVKHLSLFSYAVISLLFLSACATKIEPNTTIPAYASFLDVGIRYFGQNQNELARDSFAIYSRAAHFEGDKEGTTVGLTNRAVALRSLGQNHFAHHLMEMMFTIDPDLEALNENHATGLIDMGEFEKAEIKLSSIIDAGKAASDTYHSRGLARLHMENYSAALKDFSKELELNPQADKRCHDKVNSLLNGVDAMRLTSNDRKEIENVFEEYKEAIRLFDGEAVLETLNKIWLDSYFSNLKRKALVAGIEEMNGLELFDVMIIYYLRHHYDAQTLTEQLPLELFVEVINQGWVKSYLKKVVDGKVVVDAKIAGYQPIIRNQSCNGFFSVYATFDGALTGWKQNFVKEKNAWRVSSTHLIDIFRLISTEYAWDSYKGGDVLWLARHNVQRRLSEDKITLSPNVEKPLIQ